MAVQSYLMRCVYTGLGLRAELSVGLGGAETVFASLDDAQGDLYEVLEWQGMGCLGQRTSSALCPCALPAFVQSPATPDIGISENHVPVPCLLPALVTLLRFPPVPEPDEQCRFQVSLQLRL